MDPHARAHTHIHTIQRCLHCNCRNTVFVCTIIPWISLLAIRACSFITAGAHPPPHALNRHPPDPSKAPKGCLSFAPHTREVCFATKGLSRGTISPVTVSPVMGQEAWPTMGQTFIRHLNANTGVCCPMPLCLEAGHSHHRSLSLRNKWSFISFISYPLIEEVRCFY